MKIKIYLNIMMILIKIFKEIIKNNINTQMKKIAFYLKIRININNIKVL